MLNAIKLKKRFGELVAVNDLSFEVQKGKVFGIAGPNGAGKSTVYNLITGFYKYQGKIEFDGRDITGLPAHLIAQAGIARTFQIPQTFPSLTVTESLSLGSRFGSKEGLDLGYVQEIMRFVGLEDQCDQRTGHLNLLNKKKLMVGASLCTKSKILMLDEPMAGCNPTEIKLLMALIKKINEELNVTIIIIEHFMKVLTELAEKLLVIESGTMVRCGDPVEVVNDPVVIECYLGSDDAACN